MVSSRAPRVGMGIGVKRDRCPHSPQQAPSHQQQKAKLSGHSPRKLRAALELLLHHRTAPLVWSGEINRQSRGITDIARRRGGGDWLPKHHQHQHHRHHHQGHTINNNTISISEYAADDSSLLQANRKHVEERRRQSIPHSPTPPSTSTSPPWRRTRRRRRWWRQSCCSPVVGCLFGWQQLQAFPPGGELCCHRNYEDGQVVVCRPTPMFLQHPLTDNDLYIHQ